MSPNNTLPRAIAALPECWQDIYRMFNPLVGYEDIRQALGFKSRESASRVFSSDPDAPRPVFIGRLAMFDRAEVVLWAEKRARHSSRRGRKRTGA